GGYGQTAKRFRLRLRLSDAGWNLRARLRAHLRFGDGAPVGNGGAKGSRSACVQLGEWKWIQREAGGCDGPKNYRSRDSRDRIAEARGRSTCPGCKLREDRQGTWLGAEIRNIGIDSGNGVGVAQGTPERLRRVRKLLIRTENEEAIFRRGEPNLAVFE